MKSAMTSASPADDGELRLGILDVKLLCGAQRERQLRLVRPGCYADGLRLGQ